MKRLFVSIFSVSVLFILMNAVAGAQTMPPPPCCMWPLESLPNGMPFLQAKINISNQALQLQGINRNQLLDQIASIFFPGKKADLVVLSKQIAGKPASADSVWTVMASEETVYYRTPRSSITREYLDLVTEVGLTDGESWVKINFINDPVDPEPK